MHFLLPDLSLLSGITACELKIAHRNRKCFLLGIVCIPHLLHVELLFVSVASLCKEFMLNIQWRISRWIGDQRLSAPLNICGISQLSGPNQTEKSSRKKTVNWPDKTHDLWAKSTSLSKLWRGTLKLQSSDVWYKLWIKLYEITVFDVILIIFSCLFICICGKHGLNSFDSLSSSLFKKISNILNILLGLFFLNITYLFVKDRCPVLWNV